MKRILHGEDISRNNIQARRSLVALASGRVAFSLAIASILFGCASIPQAHPTVARVTVLPVQSGDQGFYFDTPNRDYLVSSGVPLAWFQPTARGWYLTKLQEEQAADIRDKLRNP